MHLPVRAASFLHTCRRLLLASLLIPLSAQADWRHVEPPPEAPGPGPSSFLFGTDGSLWTFSLTTVRRTDPAGNTVIVDRRGFADGYSGNPRRFAQADGGMVLVRHETPSGNVDFCSLLRVDASLRQSPIVPLSSCIYSVNDRGVAWAVADNRIVQLRTDGSTRVSVLRDGAGPRERYSQIETTADGGVLALSEGIGTGPYVTRYDDDGNQRWSWAPRSWITGLAVALDGGIYAYGPGPVVYHVDAAGRELWRRELDLSPKDLRFAGVTDSALYLVTEDHAWNLFSQHHLLRFAQDGAVWSRELCPGTRAIYDNTAIADDGRSTVNCPGGRLLHRDRQGDIVGETTLTGSLLQMTYKADGKLQLLTGATGGPARQPTTLVELDRNGSFSAGPPVDPDDYATPRFHASLTAEDGATYLLSQYEAQTLQTPTLKRINADGTVAWSRPMASGAVNSAQLSTAPGRVCVVQLNGLAQTASCLNSSNGATRWTREQTLSAGISGRIHALADGRTLLVQSTTLTEHEILLLAADGRQLRRTSGHDSVREAVFDATGRVAVYTDLGLTGYDALGQPSYFVAENHRGIGSLALAMADNGTALFAEWTNAGTVLQARRPDGSLAWQRVLSNGSGTVRLYPHGDLIVVLETFVVSQSTRETRISMLALADGAPRWQHLSPRHAPAALALIPGGPDLLFAQTAGNRLHVQRFNGMNGQLSEERTYFCGDRCDAPGSFRVDASGTARLVFQADVAPQGETIVAQAITQAAAARPLTRLDQPGIAGAWWSPYANGEGLVLDWIAPQRTLFGAWFTYTTAGGTDPAQLRWYTIQAGNVAPNATSVQLPILETTGGNFDAGPPASPIQVGTATLRFTDCDNATLLYDFDAAHNDGVSGTITLSRLTPATESCILADGTTRPGAGAKPPQGGFDARMSGTWFEEATSGQGLQLTVQPGGVLFAPWFTYDPQGQGNDANREHWFTLQGSLAAATNGTAEVVIAQSLGGAFDRVPTYNGYAVGKGTLTLTACDKSRLDYRFDDSDVAGSFRNRSGTLELSKIGGCAP